MADSTVDFAERIATLEEAQRRTDGWQKRQNGYLDDLRKEIGTLKNLIIAALLASLLNVALRFIP